MRVALIGPAHPYKGGGARHTTELARRLAEAGHDVVLESWRHQYPAGLYPGGRQTVDVPDGEPFPNTRQDLSWANPASWWRAGRRLRDADLVAFALMIPPQAVPYLGIMTAMRGASRRVRDTSPPPRTVVICHNVLPHESRPADKQLTQWLLRSAGGALTHSAEEAARARTLAPEALVTAARMPPHLPAAGPAAPLVDQAAFASRRSRTPVPAPGSCHLLFFGIVRPYKGLDVLLRALARAPEQLTLTVAGEFWGGTAATEQLIAELGLAHRVTLRPGYVPAGQIPDLFAAADVLVLPYREATASQNAQLAFAHGVPVITTTAGALAEHVRDGVNGLTCAPGDVTDLARALTAVSAAGEVTRLRAGIAPVDPEPAWAAYVQVLAGLACRSRAQSPPRQSRRSSSPPAKPAPPPARTLTT